MDPSLATLWKAVRTSDGLILKADQQGTILICSTGADEVRIVRTSNSHIPKTTFASPGPDGRVGAPTI